MYTHAYLFIIDNAVYEISSIIAIVLLLLFEQFCLKQSELDDWMIVRRKNQTKRENSAIVTISIVIASLGNIRKASEMTDTAPI